MKHLTLVNSFNPDNNPGLLESKTYVYSQLYVYDYTSEKQPFPALLNKIESMILGKANS